MRTHHLTILLQQQKIISYNKLCPGSWEMSFVDKFKVWKTSGEITVLQKIDIRENDILTSGN